MLVLCSVELADVVIWFLGELRVRPDPLYYIRDSGAVIGVFLKHQPHKIKQLLVLQILVFFDIGQCGLDILFLNVLLS